jgi:hypothetical protein
MARKDTGNLAMPSQLNSNTLQQRERLQHTAAETPRLELFNVTLNQWNGLKRRVTNTIRPCDVGFASLYSCNL